MMTRTKIFLLALAACLAAAAPAAHAQEISGQGVVGNTDISNLREQLNIDNDVITSRITTTENNVTNLNNSITQQFNQVNNNIQTLNSRVTNIENTINAINSTVNAQSSSINNNSSTINQLQGSINELNGMMSEGDSETTAQGVECRCGYAPLSESTDRNTTCWVGGDCGGKGDNPVIRYCCM